MLAAEAAGDPAQLVALAAQLAALTQIQHPHVLGVLGGRTTPPNWHTLMA